MTFSLHPLFRLPFYEQQTRFQLPFILNLSHLAIKTMNLATKIQQNKNDPRKWIGRRASLCRKHGKSIHYVNRFSQIGCVECDKPDDSNITLRLMGQDGVWCDESDGFSIVEPQRATQELTAYDTTEVDGREIQVMPMHDDGTPMTWYEFDRLHGKPKNMSYQTYVYFRWVMRGFDESDEDNDFEIRYGKSR